MTTVKITRRELTYLGVPCTLYERPLSKEHRKLVQVWHAKAIGQPVEYEAGTIVIRDVKGTYADARDVFTAIAPSLDDAIKWLEN
jgi:hypothetical protein